MQPQWRRGGRGGTERGERALTNENPLNLGDRVSQGNEEDSYPHDLTEVMDFSSFDLRTTLRLIVMSGESRRIDVHRGSKHGSIFVKGGEIYCAFTGDGKGDEAFFEMLSWDGASHTDVQQMDCPVGNVRVPTNVILDLLKTDVTRPSSP